KSVTTANMRFHAFATDIVYKFLSKTLRLWSYESDDNATNLYGMRNGQTVGLKGAAISGDLHPEMMGVGYLIGPRIACMMMAGAVLSFFVLGPMIAAFGAGLDTPVPPAKDLIRNMEPDDIYASYLRYIGAGA